MDREKFSHYADDGTAKKRFTNRKDAKAEARIMKKRFKKKFDVYPCKECLGYHIGSSKR